MQNTSHAVMAQRIEPHDSLDYFPTPPWATRALCEWLGNVRSLTCLEPACGEGHMARPLAEYFGKVHASDIHNYGYGAVADFLFAPRAGLADWIITNPPFRLAMQFVHHALPRASGVAILVRTVFLESGQRWKDLYRDDPPSDVLVFCERVPMLKGRLDKAASSATSYAWFVWDKPVSGETKLHWIPPGTGKRLEKPGDYA